MSTFQIILHVTALAAAHALAFSIGWDRESQDRSAGLRTFPLVALARCGFIQATETLLAGSPDATTRIIEGFHRRRGDPQARQLGARHGYRYRYRYRYRYQPYRDSSF